MGGVRTVCFSNNDDDIAPVVRPEVALVVVTVERVVVEQEVSGGEETQLYKHGGVRLKDRHGGVLGARTGSV